MNLQLSLSICCIFLVSSSDGWFFRSSNSNQVQNNTSALDQECIGKAQRGDCAFYYCFDRRHPCAHDNYALDYGLRFCNRFDRYYNRLTAEGQRWLNATRLCIMEYMVIHYRSNAINCRALEESMKVQYARCSAEYGICDVNMVTENTNIFTEVYKVSPRAIQRFLMMLRYCSVRSMEPIARRIADQAMDFLALINRILPGGSGGNNQN